MSGFGGGGGRSHHNNSGRGDRGGRGRGRGGRSNYNSNNNNNSNPRYPAQRLRPCRNFLNGNCTRGQSCSFQHVVKLHASIDASSPNSQNNHGGNNRNNYNSNNNNNQMHSVSSVAIWETQGAIKIFTGSEDGFWRLWNTQGGTFVKEFEHNMGGKVQCLVVESNFLFCGFESISPSLPEIPVGMIHAWNLTNPADPPLEFHVHNLIPYAHSTAVTQLLVVEGQKIVSGSRDGSIRLWTFEASANSNKGGFVLAQTLPGHAREVTGLAVAESVLWSSSTDGSIRVWNLASNGDCQYAITMATGTNPQQSPQQPLQPSPTSGGHTNAVTGLLSFKSPSGTFILSCSLDGDIKAWNGATGQCVASESHGEGVVTMSMVDDTNGNQILLIGLESGNLMARNLLQTPKAPAFSLLFVLASNFHVGHNGAVKALCKGPSSTFYSGGMDGKVLVLQFTDDLGL